jgi:hypothetical protein
MDDSEDVDEDEQPDDGTAGLNILLGTIALPFIVDLKLLFTSQLRDKNFVSFTFADDV